MTAWPRWARGVAPGAGALAQYVHRDVVARLLPAELAQRLPGPSPDPPWHRARRIYEIFAECGIGYVHEPTSSEPGRQAIRTPFEVLAVPGAGTCLDLAVTFCGSCLDAGLHPMIVALDSARGGPGHALVVVWLDGGWDGTAHPDYPWRDAGRPWRDAVHPAPPAGLVERLRGGVKQPGAFLAIDVSGAASRQDTAPMPWEEAVARGIAMLTGDQWRWAVGVDVGVAWRREDVLALPRWPKASPLVPPYLPAEPDKGPLMQLRARRGVVPFYARDELDVLLDWCQSPDVEQRTRVAVVHGVGGAGKTHVAAELASRLAGEGWFTGFLRRHPDPADLEWLAGVVSPLLIVVDYPEEVRAGLVISLLSALHARTEPACVVLTSRAFGSWWNEITRGLDGDRVPDTSLPPLELPARHPSGNGVYQRALRAFTEHLAAAPVEERLPPPNPRWTTLDLVMLAWLAVQGATDLPTSPEELYDEILDREFCYWERVSEKEDWG
ncbi:MAG: ATP-binding protein, partial [Actinomycetota bacterium]|nr:ATP-binding protein [Actinomycetota bacterium]